METILLSFDLATSVVYYNVASVYKKRIHKLAVRAVTSQATNAADCVVRAGLYWLSETIELMIKAWQCT